MTRKRNTRRHETRSGDEFAENPYFKALSQNLLFYKGVQLYNKFEKFKRNQNETNNVSTKSVKSLAHDFVKLTFPLE